MTATATAKEPNYIFCQECPVRWVISTQEPDTSLASALEHATTRHTDLAPSKVLRLVYLR